MADREATASRDRRMEEAMEKLSEGVRSITSSHEFIRYLTFISAFHKHSPTNTMLIAVQAPSATLVAGYRRWQHLGRQVKKGERGISIFCPIVKKASVGEEGEELTEGEEPAGSVKTVVGYRVVKVWDVSQTKAVSEEGELPEAPAPVILSGEEERATELESSFAEAARAQGLELSYADLGGEANGYYQPLREAITLERSRPTASRARTLAHELAHHFTSRASSNETEPSFPEDLRETIAEGAAFAVCHHFHLDASDYSFPYIARWAGDEKVLTAALDAIQKVASRLIEAVEEVGEQGYLLAETSALSR